MGGPGLSSGWVPWGGLSGAWSRWVRWLSVVLAAVLVATVGVPASAEPGRPPFEEPAAEEVEDAVAGDVVTASLNARASGEAVEVFSARDEFSSTWVNPDGSFTTQESLGQVRFRGADQEWVEVDLDLAVLPDGRVAPKGHPDGFGVGRAESNAAGRAWVGPGHRVRSDGILISRDKLRQYRPPTVKKRSGRYQSNFQWRLRPKDEWQGNGHLNIKRDP